MDQIESSGREPRTIAFGALGSVIGNYLGTVSAIALSCGAWGRPDLLIRIFRLNLNPWSEWTGGVFYTVVPFLPAAIWAILVYRKPKMSPPIAIGVIAIFSLFVVLLVDYIYIGRLPGMNGSIFAIQSSYRFARLAIMAALTVTTAQGMQKYADSRQQGPGRRSRSAGFTLIEVLVVIVIVAVIAAITFSVVAGAKQRSKSAVDIEQMKQLYMALEMYEQDSGAFPKSLTDVKPFVSSKEIFRSPADLMPTQGITDFPADLYVFDSPVRSTFRVSYTYLKAFENRSIWSPTLSWQTYYQDPAVGVLANKMYCPVSPKLDSDPGRREHDYIRGHGTVYRIRMDGSLWIAHPMDGLSSGGSINGLFVDP